MKNILRICFGLLLVAAIVTFVVLFFTSDEVQAKTTGILEWMGGLNIWLSAILMATLYAVSLLFFFPGNDLIPRSLISQKIPTNPDQIQ